MNRPLKVFQEELLNTENRTRSVGLRLEWVAMVKRAPVRRRPRKAKPGTTGLTPGESRLERVEGSAADAFAAVEKVGGAVVGMYKEPLGGHPVLLAVLPIDAIEPTPFQRDLSDTHHKRLADVIAKTGRYLDPVIAVVAPSQGFWTPNGRHRLASIWVRRSGEVFSKNHEMPSGLTAACS